MSLKRQYKSYKNKLTSLLRNAELAYYSNKLEINKSDHSKSWKVIREITGMNTIKPTHYSFSINDCIVTDKQKIANEFNNFFVNIGPHLAANIINTRDPLSYVNTFLHSIVIHNISEYDVKHIILSLKSAAAGCDNFPAYLGKQCINAYLTPLTYILNQSMTEGVFPDLLKTARVIPLYKSGEKKKINNYRPISILSFFSKIFEKTMYNYISNFMDKHNLICKHQFGFRSKHSTQHAVISLVNNITNSLDSSNIVIGVFLDLKKAFDTVDHTILLKKLYSYGIRGKAHKWLTSYLTGRTQYVVYDGHKSSTLNMTCGVPQGSILGPLLFIIYVNDICNVSELLLKILYADDTCVVAQGHNLEELIDTLNNELSSLNEWLLCNKLTLNTNKSYYMVFHRARIKLTNIDIDINGSKLQRVKCVKYLGSMVDQKLKWIDHITHVKHKVAHGLGIINKAKPFLTKKSLRNLYYSFIYPYFTYCVEVWGNAATSHMLPLCLLQNKVVRIITYTKKRAPVDSLYLELNLLPLHKIAHHRIALMMYKYHHAMLPIALQDLYIKNKIVHHHRTRQHNLLHVPSGTHTKKIIYSSILVWNNLQSMGFEFDISFHTFKKAIKTYLLHNEIDIGYNS